MNEFNKYCEAVAEMNNFAAGVYELSEPVEIGYEMDIERVDLDNPGKVYVTPSKRVWSNAYASHHFEINVESLSDEIIQKLREALEDEFRERAAWWEYEERGAELPWQYAK